MVSNGGLLVPAEVWDTVAHYIRPSPIVYARLSRVSRSARGSFTSDKQWEFLVPGVVQGRYAVFVELVAELSYEGKATLRKAWVDVEEVLGYSRCCKKYGSRDLFPPSVDTETRLQLPWAILAICLEEYGYSFYSSWGPQMIQMYCKEREFVKAMVRFDGNILRHTPAFQNVKEIAQIAFDNDADLDTFGQAIIEDCPFMTRALYIRPKMLSKAPDEVRSNRKMVIAAIRSFPEALQYASDELKDDETVVSLAISLEPMTLKFASPGLRNDQTVVSTAISLDPTTLQFASYELKNDPKIVSPDPTTLEFASTELKTTEQSSHSL